MGQIRTDKLTIAQNLVAHFELVKAELENVKRAIQLEEESEVSLLVGGQTEPKLAN